MTALQQLQQEPASEELIVSQDERRRAGTITLIKTRNESGIESVKLKVREMKHDEHSHLKW